MAKQGAQYGNKNAAGPHNKAGDFLRRNATPSGIARKYDEYHAKKVAIGALKGWVVGGSILPLGIPGAIWGAARAATKSPAREFKESLQNKVFGSSIKRGIKNTFR